MKTKEWSLDMPWGQVAMVSWGESTNPPVLMVHGYMDSAATFTPLLEHLPDAYYYVSFDMPGLGLSDHFPVGPLESQAHIVEIIRRIVEDMMWEQFIFLSHSLGFIIGLFYKAAYPGKITKMIAIDPEQSLCMYYFTTCEILLWERFFYDDYYENYSSWNTPRSKTYTYDEAVNVIKNNRGLTKEQAAKIMSRSLVAVGDGKYRFSWQPKSKKMTSVLTPIEFIRALVIENPIPTVVFEASEGNKNERKEVVEYIKETMEEFKKLPNYLTMHVKGPHDVHITSPEVLAPYIIDFLDKDFSVKAKL